MLRFLGLYFETDNTSAQLALTGDDLAILGKIAVKGGDGEISKRACAFISTLLRSSKRRAFFLLFFGLFHYTDASASYMLCRIYI
jgi:hypothetical protein